MQQCNYATIQIAMPNNKLTGKMKKSKTTSLLAINDTVHSVIVEF